jgi:hypothetical protein
MLDASGPQHLLLAETLGLAMARRATDILDRHRAALTSGGAGPGGAAPQDDDDQFAFDNAIFTAVLDAANECLGRFDTRPADDRWCDALLQVINLAQLAELLSSGGTNPPVPGSGHPSAGDGHLAGQGPSRPPGPSRGRSLASAPGAAAGSAAPFEYAEVTGVTPASCRGTSR